MNKFKINAKGFWEDENGSGHIYDSSLCNELINFLLSKNIKTLVDFGCGMGDYTKTILAKNIECEAYDGNPHTPTLTNGLASVLDLSKDFNLEKKFDCVLSLEVGEHIPKEFEQIFIDNLCKHAKELIILSWAVVGQGGDGHVNCQNNDYIISNFENRGFIYDKTSSNTLRNSSSVASWFKNTIMVFEKI